MIQHVGKAVKKVIGRCTRSAAGKQTLDSQLHLFLRNQEDLSAEEEQARASLAQAFPELNAAWQLKEDSRPWYAIASAQTAVAQLDAWIAHVNQKGLLNSAKPCLPFAVFRHEILACFDFLPTRLSHGFVEDKSNRTKASMHETYGYRNRRHLRLRILVEVPA